MELDVLTEAIDQLAEADPATLGHGEAVIALQHQLARLEAVATKATASFDASREWMADGARDPAGWLVHRCHLPRRQAGRLVRRGRELRHLPVSASAWLRGEVTVAQVDVLVGLRNEATEDALERDEKVLVDQAVKLPYRYFVKAASYWEQHADPDGTEEAEVKRQGRRDVYLTQSFQGLWLGQMSLDPITGAIVANELSRLEHELFEADWAKAKDELGREPTIAELPRTSGQRRADALKEMAIRSRTAPADGRRPAPSFSILVDYPTLAGRVCELAQGIVVSPGSLVPWLTEAYFERAVFTPGTRVEVSPTARLFTGATKRAIELRDRECTHPYCDRSTGCQVDHVTPYAEGGPTTQENGRLLCGFHNRLRNQRPPPDG